MIADHTATRTKITVPQVRGALESIAAAYPARRDERVGLAPTRYVHRDGTPDGLVAHVLRSLGFPISVLRALEREHPTGDIINAGVYVAESRNPALRCIDGAALALLDYVQGHQASGRTWGRVIAEALRPPRLPFRRLGRRRKPWLYAEEPTTGES